jgi:phosphoglycolate phosphatase-like HAD superfamily hydrolase
VPILFLFDIDGTLLWANGAGRSAVERALADACGQPISTEAISFSGKTDPQIMREVLDANGVRPTDDQVSRALTAYTEAATSALSASDVTLLPGVPDLLQRLAERDDVHLGLVTGNIERMAYHKLAVAGADEWFSFGAFGSDHADRNELPGLALERAYRHTGHRFTGSDAVVVGDTRRDIACARHAGARAVGVCTGGDAREDLEAAQPDLLLDDLTDTAAFLQSTLPASPSTSLS